MGRADIVSVKNWRQTCDGSRLKKVIHVDIKERGASFCR